MREINVLLGNQPTKEVVADKRVTQTDLLPGCVKPRHLEIGLAAIKFGQDAALPADGSTYPAFFALDTFKLYIWTGSVWKSTTLA